MNVRMHQVDARLSNAKGSTNKS